MKEIPVRLKFISSFHLYLNLAFGYKYKNHKKNNRDKIKRMAILKPYS